MYPPTALLGLAAGLPAWNFQIGGKFTRSPPITLDRHHSGNLVLAVPPEMIDNWLPVEHQDGRLKFAFVAAM